jgi:hypothetical protein
MAAVRSDFDMSVLKIWDPEITVMRMARDGLGAQALSCAVPKKECDSSRCGEKQFLLQCTCKIRRIV